MTAKSSKVTLVALAFMALVFMAARLEAQTPAPAAAAGPSIGVFNLQEAINESQKGKAAKAKLSSKYEKMEQELRSREVELDKKNKDLQKQAPTLSKEALNQKQGALREELKSFQGKVQAYTEDMQKAEQDSLKPLFDEAIKTAETLGRQKGFVMVIEAQKAGVIYSADGLDLTKDVIKALDGKK